MRTVAAGLVGVELGLGRRKALPEAAARARVAAKRDRISNNNACRSGVLWCGGGAFQSETNGRHAGQKGR